MIKGAAARNATTPLCSITNSDLLGQNPDQTANPSHEERIVRLSAGIAVGLDLFGSRCSAHNARWVRSHLLLRGAVATADVYGLFG